MSLIILIFVLIIALILRKRQFDTLSKRMLLAFVILWGVVLSLSTLGLFDLYTPSSFALFLLVLNVVMFSLGFCVVKTSHYSQPFSADSICPLMEKIYRSKLFLPILIISTIVSVTFFRVVQSTFNQYGSLADLRVDYYENTLFGKSFLLINNVLLEPMETLCLPVFAYMFFFKRDWRLFLLTVFLFTHASLSGGRFGYLRIIAAVVFMGFCLISDKKTWKKRVTSTMLAAVGFFLVVGIVTAMRSGSTKMDSDSTVEALYEYGVAPVTAFDHSLKNNYVHQIGGYKYGGLTGSSILSLSYSIFNKIGVYIHQPIVDLIELKQETYFYVSPNRAWNALYTSVLYFYLDGGILGVILIPFILGMIMRWLINRLYRYRTWPFIVIVSYFFHVMIRSITDFNFATAFPLITIIVLYYLGVRSSYIKPASKV